MFNKFTIETVRVEGMAVINLLHEQVPFSTALCLLTHCIGLCTAIDA